MGGPPAGRAMSFFERFTRAIDSAGPCWNWRGRAMPDGYGMCGNLSRAPCRHELFVGPIPVGLDLDHLCRNRLCVRPDHLEPVTNIETNILRGEGVTAQNARKNPIASEDMNLPQEHRPSR